MKIYFKDSEARQTFTRKIKAAGYVRTANCYWVECWYSEENDEELTLVLE